MDPFVGAVALGDVAQDAFDAGERAGIVIQEGAVQLGRHHLPVAPLDRQRIVCEAAGMRPQRGQKRVVLGRLDQEILKTAPDDRGGRLAEQPLDRRRHHHDAIMPVDPIEDVAHVFEKAAKVVLRSL